MIHVSEFQNIKKGNILIKLYYKPTLVDLIDQMT